MAPSDMTTEDKQALVARVFELSRQWREIGLKREEAFAECLSAHSEFQVGDRVEWDTVHGPEHGSVIKITGTYGNPDRPEWQIREDGTRHTVRIGRDRGMRKI